MFSAALQDLIRDLGTVLLQLDDSFNRTLQQSLERLTVETSTLMGCMKQFNPPLYKAALEGRLAPHESEHQTKLDAAWFSSLPVSLTRL